MVRLFSILALWGVSTGALAQVPNAHPRAAMFEVGAGYETGVDTGSENLLIEVQLRPTFPGHPGAPETTFYRTRMEFSGGLDVSTGQVPYFKMTLVPVELAANIAPSPRDLIAAGLGFVPLNVSRDVRMGRDVTFTLNLIGAHVELDHQFDRYWGMVAALMADALGYKFIESVRGTEEFDFQGLNLARLKAGFGLYLRVDRIVTFTLYASVQADMNLGEVAGEGLTYQQDMAGTLELQATIARHVTLFTRLSSTQAYYGAPDVVTPGIVQFLAGVRALF